MRLKKPSEAKKYQVVALLDLQPLLGFPNDRSLEVEKIHHKSPPLVLELVGTQTFLIFFRPMWRLPEAYTLPQFV
jgi:hypothetical protein